jgi:hypothetical protein
MRKNITRVLAAGAAGAAVGAAVASTHKACVFWNS